jgi:hypothetical protein
LNSTLRNILAVVAGFLVGSTVNMALIMSNGLLIPLPPGVDLSTPEGLNAAMPLFGPQHFITPFLAHALGTLVGAAVAAGLAVGRRIIPAMVIGACFFAGGIAAVMMIPAPLWFDLTDLVFAYFPAAYLGYKIALRFKPTAS